MVRLVAILGAATLLIVSGGPGAPVAGAVGEAISGSGSTWSFPMVNQWRADVASQGTNVNIGPGGSSVGRQQFADGITDFGDSDIAYQGRDLLTGQQDVSIRAYAYIPVIAGGTSLMYHLEAGGQLIRNVRLSDLTVARIFTGKITMWNDPAITADMNGHALPAKKIQVIVNSQGAGTSFQFTDWLSKRHPDLWKDYAGNNVPTSYYPIKLPNFSGQAGDDRIAATIEGPNADGAISFVQYSYPFSKGWPVAKVLNPGGYYTVPTPGNVAFALQSARVETANHDPKVYLTQDLSGVYTAGDPRVYPLSSYSYMIIPIDPSDPHETEGKAQTFANFSYYSLCNGQAKAPALGYSPLPYVLVQAAFDQVPNYSKMKPEFHSNQDPKTCDNPTFDKNNLNRNLLAETDPLPPPCDRVGQGPCESNDPNSPSSRNPAGGAGGNGNGNGANGNGNGNGANGNGANDDAANGNANGDNAAQDAALGLGQDQNGSADSAVAGTSSQLAAFRGSGMTTLLGVLAAIELILVLLVPALVRRALERRQQGQKNGNG
ncbi:substrate-binding domain-containing protein [Amycolatopsis sp. GM8]|uniref:substrate-binding domain-containing protein n=1 Tax=Amycolatopsis sp. GM8 TaxID=2896530 RepID=UPI001F2B0670|nr:substrate-binding domain-containing protein [Amycolatopsis sp. GM8]